MNKPGLAARLERTIDDFPRPFWTLVIASFADQVGGALLFPFYSLYVTRKFGVGMAEVGLVFALFSITNIAGNMLGGALADRMGRKAMVVFGLVTSAGSTLFLGLVNNLDAFIVGVIFVGLFASAGGPAQQAMVADLLPEEKRAQGFGILRVSFNLAVTIGPAVGGLLAARSYLLLFIADTIGSLITAAIVVAALPETRPASAPGHPREPWLETFRGYGKVLRDGVFMTFIGACTLMTIAYIQMNTTLGVYLRDVHHVSEAGYGAILSLNAGMVVLFQFAVTRRIRGYPAYVMMAVGALLYAGGFAMYGLVYSYALFLLAMVVITVGEMIVAPVSQALVAGMAPEDMRGRYLAMFGFAWVIPGALGPALAGLVMDRADPRWVWYGAGLLGLASAAWFARMQADMRVPVEAVSGESGAAA